MINFMNDSPFYCICIGIKKPMRVITTKRNVIVSSKKNYLEHECNFPYVKNFNLKKLKLYKKI